MEIPILVAIAVAVGVVSVYAVQRKQILLRDFTQGRQSRFREVKILLVTGALATSLFLCFSIVVGFLDRQYIWTPGNIVAIVAISLLAGLAVGLVSLIGFTWSFFVISKHRAMLYPRLRGNQDPKDQSRDSK